MTFARYLQDTLTPEWEKAYIDYSGLKETLGAIREDAPRKVHPSHSFANPSTNHDNGRHFTAKNKETIYDIQEVYLGGANPPGAPRMRTSHRKMPSYTLRSPGFAPRRTGPGLNGGSEQFSAPRIIYHSPVVPTFPKDSGISPSPPLAAIRSSLPFAHIRFFNKLDAELDKVAAFYAERGEEMRERSELLRRQLHELGKHRQMFYESTAQSNSPNLAKRAYLLVTPVLSSLVQCIVGRNKISQEAHQTRGTIRPGSSYYGSWRTAGVAERGTEGGLGTKGLAWPPPKYTYGGKVYPFNPQEYGNAKRRLRKAVVEHYRGLEMLSKYRTLNLTGFRKVLSKYGKISKTSVLDVYMKEKIEPCAFVSDTMISSLLKETEQLFAARFERGNKKKATRLLQFELPTKTQHFSMLRIGLCLGIALCGTVGGCYLSSREQTRNTLLSWNLLLFVYSVLVIPVLLAFLIGLNILAWTRERINYVFILKLNARSRLDCREYFELPSFLLCTLACAFWLTFAQIGPPMLWPLLWLILALVIMLNPIHSIMYGDARWWTIRKLAKLGVSGLWTVEFADLWLGDQMCSLVYPLTNIFFMGCFYTRTFPDDLPGPVSFSINITLSESSARQSAFQGILSSAYKRGAQEAMATCGASQNWKWYTFIGILPFFIRFVQCVSRYRDSKLPTQLMNAGKYVMGMLYYTFYFYWRHQENSRTGKSYIFWCLAAIANSLYACAWDFFVDWSMCKPYAQYPLLRPEVIYKTHIPLYYVAMILNLFCRFDWLLFIYFNEVDFEVRAFIAAMLEMLRRVVWNFYRLENKHISNMALYHATRDMPLPYYFDPHSRDSEGVNAARLQMRKRIARLS